MDLGKVAAFVKTPGGKVAAVLLGAGLLYLLLRKSGGGAGNGTPSAPLGDPLGDSLGGSLGGATTALRGNNIPGTADNSLAQQVALWNAQQSFEDAKRLSDYNFLFSPLTEAEGARLPGKNVNRQREEVSQGGFGFLRNRFDILYEAQNRGAVDAYNMQQGDKERDFARQQQLIDQQNRAAKAARNPFSSIGNFLSFGLDVAKTATGFGGGSRSSSPSIPLPAPTSMPAPATPTTFPRTPTAGPGGITFTF